MERDVTVKGLSETSSLATEAYTIVRERILAGELQLGQVISRRTLAAELGMSFLPVTEALLRLQLEGLLESRPRAGTRVRIPSPEDVRGLFIVREALETQAARIVCVTASPKERAELKRLATRVDLLSSRDDRRAYARLHHRLHGRIADLAGCAPLREAIEKTQALSTIWFCTIGEPGTHSSSTRHRDLVDAIVAGTPDQAVDAVRHHVADGAVRTLELLEPYFRLRTRARSFHRRPRGVQKSPSMLSLPN